MSQFEIITLSLGEIGAARSLFAKTRYKPYRFLSGSLSDSLDVFWLNEIADSYKDGQTKVFAAMAGDETRGVIVYTDNPWEAKLFGKRMGVLRCVVVDPYSPQKGDITNQLLNHTIDWAAGNGIKGLLCKTYTDDVLTIHALEQHGFLLMDTVLDYVYDLRKHSFDSVPRPQAIPGNRIRLADQNDMEEMVALSRAAFREHFGRYHADERISRRQATLVYEEWVKASFKGWADRILVAEINGRIVGYSIWKKPSRGEQSLAIRLGHYSIGAVDPNHYGQGLFSLLTYEGMKLFDGEVDCIESPTHVNNYPVQRAFAKLLWRIADARHSFNRWFTAGNMA